MHEQRIARKVKRAIGKRYDRHAGCRRAYAERIHGPKGSDVIVSDLCECDSAGSGHQVKIRSGTGGKRCNQ
jgi:hypothetical protein